MHHPKITENMVTEMNIGWKLKLAALWTSFMFLYIYVDYFALYMPGKIDGILKGQIFVFDISEVFLLIALVSVSIPAIMIALSVVLPSKANRLCNMLVAALYIPYSLFNLAGEHWPHMLFGAAVEVGILLLIMRLAWKAGV
ncbi:MAG: DUF6326 family protein [Bacteroidota bacterium]|nr:DUF6326 family protein [Bacteroidota bacterium]MDX5429674.1 DUF6326 family protein [Bacteroidota bacterium]MDX5468452.1 DUF6326 family protein [Bacteroidota bacterium]